MDTGAATGVRARGARRPGEAVPFPTGPGLVWGALFLNVLAFTDLPTALPVPGVVGQLVTQLSLFAALGLALLVNRAVIVRPDFYLVALTLLPVMAAMVSIHNQFMVGSTYRVGRFVVFVAVLWLLSPWFGRRDMTLLRCHVTCLSVVLGSVVLGAVVAPGAAFSYDGRLSGAIWPIPPTQVAHYAAVLVGLSALLWMCRVISGPRAAVTVGLGAAILVGTHTRTAVVACLVGLACASVSLFLGNARVRRTFLWGSVVAVAVAGVFAGELGTWALRGQSAEEAGGLTGRTQVWTEAISTPRTLMETLFGSGLSNLSFEGLAIDSNWVATFLDQGLFGVVVCATILLGLLVLAVTAPRSPHRAIALFLVMYCVFASITETGMSNPSPYLLELAVASSLLLPRSSEPS